MAIATPEVYLEMLDRARAGRFAYPAVNITSSQTITAALQGFAEAGSDGILQVSVGGAEYASGSTVKDRVSGSLALAAYATEVAKGYPLPRACVLVLGQEGSGLSEAAREACDDVLHIRQFGSTRSINAGAAAAIAMHTWVTLHAGPPGERS